MKAAAYTSLIPASELYPRQASEIRGGVIQAIINIAVAELHLPESELVVRDIRAKDDLALYSKGADADVEDWACVTGTTINAYETMTTGTMADQRWVGLYGVKISEGCAVTALRIATGGAQRAIWQIQSLGLQDDWVGLSMAAVIIPQNVLYTIDRWVRQASSSAFVLLKGVVVEPRGKLITP